MTTFNNEALGCGVPLLSGMSAYSRDIVTKTQKLIDGCVKNYFNYSSPYVVLDDRKLHNMPEKGYRQITYVINDSQLKESKKEKDAPLVAASYYVGGGHSGKKQLTRTSIHALLVKTVRPKLISKWGNSNHDYGMLYMYQFKANKANLTKLQNLVDKLKKFEDGANKVSKK